MNDLLVRAVAANALGHRSSARSLRGWEQQMSVLPPAGSSTGSGA
jgi:hypothetical protein